MGNVNMESYQIHYKGEETAKTMFEKLDLIAQQVGDLPTFTSDDRAFLEKLPALPTAEGKTVLTAETDDQGETNLSYAAPEVKGEDVAPEFSDAEAYSSGDLVFHDGILYKFTSDHAAGDWDATEATPTSVDRELSELKSTLTSVVDALTYSTTEHVVGKWIDGSSLYEKTINVGALPDSAAKRTPHNIDNLNLIIDMRGYATDGSSIFPLPFSSYAGIANNIQLSADSTDVSVSCGSNRTTFTGYVTIRYTKFGS